MSRTMKALLALLALVAVAAGLIAVLAARNGSGPKDTAPLTGLPRGDADLDRPALLVKIDNAAPARPQAGLVEADVVYEEGVEGFLTRFAAVFHSQAAETVGPVRSGRSTDVLIGTPLDEPLFSYSGANPTFRDLIRASSLVDVGAELQPDAYERRPDRSAPHDLYTSTSTLWDLPVDDAGRPPALFDYAEDGPPASTGSAPVQGTRFDFGAAAVLAAGYDWNDEASAWFRTQDGSPHVVESGVQITPDNVILQLVDYVDSGVNDASDNPIPEADLVGEGVAWVFSDGQLVVGRWSRADESAVTAFVDGGGEPILLTPGTTWVELVPPGRATVICADGSESASGDCGGATGG